MQVKCDDPKKIGCAYEWDFEANKIKNPLYCTCPRCNGKVRLREGQG